MYEKAMVYMPVKIPATLKDALQAKADDRKVSLSAYVRDVLANAAGVRLPKPEAKS